MKKILRLPGLLFFAILFPFVTSAQKSNNGADKSAAGHFEISGIALGVADGTSLSLYNGTSGVPEASTTVQGEKFSFTGSVPTPEPKVIVMDNKPPYLTFFVENRPLEIKFTGHDFKDASVKGSTSQDEYAILAKILDKYSPVFIQDGNADEAMKKQAASEIAHYVSKHYSSFTAPLALFRYFQASQDAIATDSLFEKVSPPVKDAVLGKSLAKTLGELMRNPIGKTVPDFTQNDPDGKPVSLKSFRGQYVLVDFWASWCGPCRQENPNVVATYNKYKDKNYTVLGVSFDKSKQPWLDAIRKDNLTWTHVSDLQGWANAVGQQFNITSIPQNFLIDPNGKLIGKNLRGADLEAKLASIFGY